MSVVEIWPSFHSHNLGNQRRIWAYLPPGYDESATYPVVYMTDGENLFSMQPKLGQGGWQVDVTLDAMNHAAIVIAPESAAREEEYATGADRYLRFLVDELKPQVDARLRTGAETAVFGSSLGGYFACYAGVHRPDVFTLVGAMSPSTWWGDEAIVAAVRDARSRPHRVYIDCGKRDDGLSETRRLVDAYAMHEDLLFVVENGEHHERSWARRLPRAFAFLLQGK